MPCALVGFLKVMQELIPRALKLAAVAAVVFTFLWQVAHGICPVP